MSQTDCKQGAVRRATSSDLADITRIYNHYVETSHVTFDVEPFAIGERVPWFSQFGDKRLQCWVAEASGSVVGYACTTRFRGKPAYFPSVEVSIYLDEAAIGSGWGNRLYERMLDAIIHTDVHRAYAGIALPNDASHRLHEAHGFRELATFSEVGRKFDRYWDVLWMEKRF